jgi:hypothetical protein
VRLSQAREPRARGVASPRALLLVCAAVAIIVAAPVLISVLQAAQGGVGAARIALRATSVSLLLHSVLVALVAAPTCAVVGVGTAWFVERTSCPLGDLPLIPRQLRGPVHAMIRPEQIRIHRRAGEAPAADAPRGEVAAEVLAVAFYGPEATVTLRVDGVQAAVVARAFSHGRPAGGERVSLAVEGPVMGYRR